MAFAACSVGDDSNDQNGTPGTPDAATQAQNVLGQVCSTANPCPTNPAHQCVILSVGSQNQGYCSPACVSATECTDGYSGPTSGEINCFVPNQPNACSIVCTTVNDCPGDLACVSTGGPLSFCAVAP